MHKDNGKKYTITTYREKAPSYRLPSSLLFGMPPIPTYLDPPHKPHKYIYLQGTSPSAHIGRSETKRKGTITSLPSPSSLMEIKKESPKRQKPATAISEPQLLRFSRRKTRICARDFFRFGSTFFLFSRQNEKFYARHFQGHETSFFPRHFAFSSRPLSAVRRTIRLLILFRLYIVDRDYSRGRCRSPVCIPYSSPNEGLP